jgi:heme-degrading monooxygenase HmoA
MFGTVAFLKALPGRRDDLSELFDDRPVPVVSGWIANYLFALEDDPEEAILVSIFDDRDTYRANADSREQHERYLKVRALLTTDPGWNDGEMFPYMSLQEPAADASAYGSVARLSVIHNRRDALHDYMEARTARFDEIPGMLAGYLVFAESDPSLVFIVTVFDSRENYRSNSEDPQQHERYLGMRSFLTRDPDWYNGYITSYLRF